MHGKIVKLILIGLKISFALSLIYYLFNEGAIDFTPVLDLLHRRTKVLALTALLLLMGLVLSGLRWWFLMRAAGFRLRLGLVLRLQLIGAFFSTWLPGAAGGDAARGAYIMRLLAARRTTALLTVAMDRLFSLFGLIFVAAVLVLLNFKEAGAQPILEFYVLLILVTMAAGALGVVLVYIAAVRLRVHTLPQWIEKLRPYAHQLRGAVILVGSR